MNNNGLQGWMKMDRIPMGKKFIFETLNSLFNACKKFFAQFFVLKRDFGLFQLPKPK